MCPSQPGALLLLQDLESAAPSPCALQTAYLKTPFCLYDRFSHRHVHVLIIRPDFRSWLFHRVCERENLNELLVPALGWVTGLRDPIGIPERRFVLWRDG